MFILVQSQKCTYFQQYVRMIRWKVFVQDNAGSIENWCLVSRDVIDHFNVLPDDVETPKAEADEADPQHSHGDREAAFFQPL